MESNNFIGHVRDKDGGVQLLSDHLYEVAELSQEFSIKINASEAGYALGILHDFGKFSKAFQNYINSAQGRIRPDEDEYVDADKLKGKIDHSSAGAQLVWRKLKGFGGNGQGEIVSQILALCIASHHSGLINCIDSDGTNTFKRRIEKPDIQTHLSESLNNADSGVPEKINSVMNQNLVKSVFFRLREMVSFSNTNCENYTKIDSFNLGFFTRFLFSCLVDADRINSAEFEYPMRKNQRISRQLWLDWRIAVQRTEAYISCLKPKKPIDFLRKRISDECRTRANDPQGIYSLTVPTGGGKTLTSLRYALHHALKHKLDRIIYIIPYTSIIDQNAKAVREVIEHLDDDFPWVLEHHSNIDPEHQTWHAKLVSENWDAPIIFTTMVQFLEVLFGGGTRGVRRMHQLSRSVLIFDEIQTLPINCVHLFCNALNFLSLQANTTALLCTATQPILDQLRFKDKGQLKMAENAELVGDVHQLFSDLSRVKINNLTSIEGWNREQIIELAAQRFYDTGSCLIIVNTKRWAQTLYQIFKETLDSETIFHLSTSLCPAHRKNNLSLIKDRLAKGLPVLCVSTQLIEAGVDVSFATVIRFLAGLDSIAQAAGRCNRHGELKDDNGLSIKGQVYVVNPDSEPVEKLSNIQVGKEKSLRVFSENPDQIDWISPDIMGRYFKYYFYDRSDEMDYPIKSKKHPPEQTLLNLLGQNSLNVNSEHKNRGNKIPLLRHGFMEAAQLFKAIDAPTHSVVVSFGKGKALITDLCRLAKDFEPQAYYTVLKEAQQYSVNIFPNVWQKLLEIGAVHETQPGEGIYFLEESYYSSEFGVSVEKVGDMDNFIIDGVF